MTLSPVQIGMARILMENGSSLVDAAVSIGVRSSDLDLALWRNLGVPLDELLKAKRRVRKRKYAPDF